MCSAMLSLTARPRSPRRTWTSACMACGVIGSLCKWSLRCSRLQASWTLRAAGFAVDLCCCCGARTACATAARGCAPNWVQGAAGLLWEANYAVEPGQPAQLHLLVCLPSGRPLLAMHLQGSLFRSQDNQPGSPLGQVATSLASQGGVAASSSESSSADAWQSMRVPPACSAGWPAVSTPVLRSLAGKPGAALRALKEEYRVDLHVAGRLTAQCPS